MRPICLWLAVGGIVASMRGESPATPPLRHERLRQQLQLDLAAGNSRAALPLAPTASAIPQPAPPPLSASSQNTEEEDRRAPQPRPRLEPGWDIPPEKAPTPTPEPTPTPSAEDLVILDKLVVQAQRDPFLQAYRWQWGERQARAQASIEKINNSRIDEVLNHPLISFLGPYSTQNRIAAAQAELSTLDFEHLILAALEGAESEAEAQALRRLLIEVRYARRMR